MKEADCGRVKITVLEIGFRTTSEVQICKQIDLMSDYKANV